MSVRKMVTVSGASPQLQLAEFCRVTQQSMRSISLAAGLGPKAVADIIAGKSANPNPETLAALSAVTGLTLAPRLEVVRPATLADVIAAVDADPHLPPASQRDLRTAIKRHARWVAQAPEALPANPEEVRAAYTGLAFRQAGFPSYRRFTNYLRHLDRAIELLRPPAAKPARFLSPGWRALLDPLTGWEAAPLSRLARFAGGRGVEPGGLDDAVVAAFRQDLEQSGVHKMKPTTIGKKVDDAIRAWNRCVDHCAINGWPQRRLTLPPDRRRRLPVCDLAVLKIEFDAFAAWAQGRTTAEGVPLLAFDDDPYADLLAEPTSASLPRKHSLGDRTIYRLWQALELSAKSQIAAGVEPGMVQSIAACVNPAAVVTTLRAIRARSLDGKARIAFEESSYSLGIAKSLRLLAAEWVRAPEADLVLLGRAVYTAAPGVRVQGSNGIRKITVKGMTASNKTRLQQFADPAVVTGLLRLVDGLWDEAMAGSKGRCQPNLSAARAAEEAVALMILLRLSPMRRGNLIMLQDRHFRAAIGSQPPELYIPPEEIKGRTSAIRRQIKDQWWRVLQTYRQVFRPVLTGGVTTPWLFPSPRNPEKALAAATLAERLISRIQNHLGIRINLHLIRHLFGYLMVKRNPASLSMVADGLGHASVATTRRYYVEPNTDAASEEYDLILAEHERLRPRGRRRN